MTSVAKLPAFRLTKRNKRFLEAVHHFKSSGGSFEEADTLLRSVYELPKEGRRACADKAGSLLPSSAPSSERRAKISVPQGQPLFAPRSRPGHAKRGAAAVEAVQKTVGKSLFDTIKLPDGRTLREVHWHECPNLASRYRRISRILMLIYNVHVPSDPNTRLDGVVSEKALENIVEQADRFNDIH